VSATVFRWSAGGREVTQRSPSLSRRLLLAALVLMPLSLGATGAYLERAHREALDAAISERLQLQVITLLALADVGETFELPLMPLESRLLQPGSGLYAMVSEGPGEPLWISPSAALLSDALRQLGDEIPVLAPGDRHDSERDGLLRHAYQVRWELDNGEQKLLRFVVAESAAPDYPELQREQLDRMDEVMQWHLQRAVGGSHRLLQRVAVLPVVERLRATLLKVYAGRGLTIDVHGDDAARYRGDERDLMELLGNLLDNACKYSASQVRVAAQRDEEAGGLLLVVEDDGEGISPELRDALLTRGTRADSRQEGQGIGLAVVKDIVAAQRGELSLGDSELGGARVELRLP